jgi:glucose/mannose transport system substrate-binding protein
MMSKTLRFTAIYTGLALATAACGGGSGNNDGGGTGGAPSNTGTTTVELFSWWTAPGEAEALQALVDLQKTRFPKERIYNAAADSGTDAKAALKARLADNHPPDLFQENAHDMRVLLDANPGKVEALDDFFAEQGLMSAIVPEIIDEVTVEGHIYSLPVNVHRENSLFYNKQIFAKNGLEPPTTLAQFFTVCEALKKAGVTPVATSQQGWITRILFNSLAMGSMGPEAFRDYWSGKSVLDEAAMGKAVDALDHVITDYANDTSDPDFGWTQAAESVFEGKAAMFLHGDWAKGYFVQLGWTPDVDFGVVGAPGAADLFWYGVDVFALPTGAPHSSAAHDFLSTVSSVAGQVAFNSIKGSSPMRLDVPPTDLDPMGQKVLADLNGAKIRMLVRSKDAWDTALSTFTMTHDKAALVQAYKDNAPDK